MVRRSDTARYLRLADARHRTALSAAGDRRFFDGRLFQKTEQLFIRVLGHATIFAAVRPRDRSRIRDTLAQAVIFRAQMRFVFSRRFYLLFALGLLPLYVSWGLPVLRPLVIAFDCFLVLAAVGDYFASRGRVGALNIRREFDRRFGIG